MFLLIIFKLLYLNDFSCFKDFNNFKNLDFKVTKLKEEPPLWNLSYLYKDHNSSNIKNDIIKSYKEALNFRVKNINRISKESINPKEMLDILIEYENILSKAILPLVYLNNISNTALLDENIRISLSFIQNEYSKINKELAFLENELSKTSLKFQSVLLDSKLLANYKTYLQNIFKRKAYTLSDNEEKIIIDKNLAAKTAWVRFRNIYETRFNFTMPNDTKTYSLTELIKFMQHNDRELRKTAANLYLNKFKEENDIFSYIYNSIVQDRIRTSQGIRGFKSIEQEMNFYNYLDDKVVDNLHSAVKKNYKLAQKYWTLKAKILNIKDFANYDLYAPYPLSETINFSFDEAVNDIQKTLDNFYPLAGDIFKNLYICNLIDANVYKGKRGGAYCSSFGTLAPPLVLMNYTGSLLDVFTLAHEAGHWLHFALIAQNQNILNHDIPIPVAETASIFNEILLSNTIKEKFKSDQKKQIYFQMKKLDDFMASVYRQIVFSFFEKEVFKSSQNSILESERFAKIFEQEYSKLFGKAVKMSTNYKYEWARIPHFVSTPFYVYSYAFGELISIAIYQQYTKDKENFPDKYIKFLSSGSSLNPEDLYKILDIDIRKQAIWNDSFKYIENQIDELELLYKIVKD